MFRQFAVRSGLVLFSVLGWGLGCSQSAIPEGDKIAEESLGAAHQAWSAPGHVTLAEYAVRQVNGEALLLDYPLSGSTPVDCDSAGLSPVLRGDCDTDEPGDTILSAHYGRNVFDGALSQHLHFNL